VSLLQPLTLHIISIPTDYNHNKYLLAKCKILHLRKDVFYILRISLSMHFQICEIINLVYDFKTILTIIRSLNGQISTIKQAFYLTHFDSSQSVQDIHHHNNMDNQFQITHNHRRSLRSFLILPRYTFHKITHVFPSWTFKYNLPKNFVN